MEGCLEVAQLEAWSDGVGVVSLDVDTAHTNGTPPGRAEPAPRAAFTGWEGFLRAECRGATVAAGAG